MEGSNEQARGRSGVVRIQAELTRAIIGGAIDVHRELGPGLLESVYRESLVYELHERRLHVEQEVPVAIRYRGRELASHLRIDLVVERQVIVELKSVKQLDNVHLAQLITYVRLSELPIGLLLNFNVVLLKDGIRRIVRPFPTLA
jgi:GxxExxY protein